MYPYVSGDFKPVERHSNVGSLSEMTAKADVLKQEWDRKVFITFYKFSVTEIKLSKTLVAYFSATGRTRKIANLIAEITGADIYEIKPAVPYSVEDLNWEDSNSRSTFEAKEDLHPSLADRNANISNYSVIYLGFPIWWYKAPRLINTFLESYDFSGKKVVTFSTSGGSGYGETSKDLKYSNPDAEIIEGKVFRGRPDKETIFNWLQSLNI